MTRFPSGWWIVPAFALSILMWIGLASLAFGSTGGEVIDPEFTFTFADFLALHARNLVLVVVFAGVIGIGLSIALE